MLVAASDSIYDSDGIRLAELMALKAAGATVGDYGRGDAFRARLITPTWTDSRTACFSEPWLGRGLRVGVGAMAGDSIKSFFKRRVGIAPGHAWIPFDQLDSSSERCS